MKEVKIIKGVFALILLLVIAACEDVLQVEEQTAIDGDRVFNEAGLSELYLNSIYQSVLPGFSATSAVGLTDESVGGGALIYGNLPDPTTNQPDETPGPYSYTTYAKIRNINLFLQQVGQGAIPQDAKDGLMGQAYFLRAWVYWDMVLHYGGVPLVLTPLDVNDENLNEDLPRNSAGECVGQIVQDLDKAIELIGDYSDSEYGKITRAAAAAFKGRVLLFFASPQFVPNGMNNPDGISARWEAAYNANLEALQIAQQGGHGLFPDFDRIFIEEDNQEAIMIRKYTTGLSTHGYENAVRPASVDNSGAPGSTPSWNLAKSFPMKDGKPIEESPDYEPAVYWKDRDPRFYATIAYNSIPWSFEGREGDRQWTYVNNSQESNILPLNGFYVKKHINTNITSTQTVATPTDWIEIRYAEVLMNLAEAANEIGRQAEALEQLYAIRERAGIEQGTGNYGIPTGLSKSELRALILNERKIEFAYENKRYWDLRRWNLYENGPDGTLGAGLNGTKRERIITTVDTDFIIATNPGITVATDPTDSAFKYFESELIHSVNWDNPDNYSSYFNTTVENAETIDINYLQPKYNFFYLPINALVKNPELEQTRLWGEGTFDPLVD